MKPIAKRYWLVIVLVSFGLHEGALGDLPGNTPVTQTLIPNDSGDGPALAASQPATTHLGGDFPPVLMASELPAGKVRVELFDQGMPSKNKWPTTRPSNPVATYEEVAFGFFREPIKYVDTGVRGEWGIPHLLRAAAVVTLPAGRHRLLLRGMGAARLAIDGKPLLVTGFAPEDGSGHGLIATQKNYLDLEPGTRFRAPGNREAMCEWDCAAGQHLVVLETMVGSFTGKAKRRPELGETVAAWSAPGSSSWELITPASEPVAYTDAGWLRYEAQRNAALDATDAAARLACRQKDAGYWQHRRELAQAWLKSTSDPATPSLPAGFAANNPIDHFIADRIVSVAAQMQRASTGSVDYFRQVRPILEAHCYECHRGVKAKGGLHLDDAALALKGGKSGDPALVPHDARHSQIVLRSTTTDADELMPPKGDRLTTTEVALITRWIDEGANWPEFQLENTQPTAICDDLTFLRRASLDTVGVPPSLEEINAFQADRSAEKRVHAVDRLLADPRFADHWMGYWQDVLAENPNILNPTLNNTGPFRWWLYESLLDNKPMDLFVTELLRMRGSERFGGPAGFGVASQNDVPMAAKGTIVSAAFLGVQMKCARCHDAPAHRSTQEDLFSLGAMLKMAPLEVAKTSSVPMDRIHEGGRKPLITVTLKPGQKIQPVWPFKEYCDEATAASLAQYPDDSRDRLAAAITAPQNQRFAQVMVNRIWARLMGRGIVEPVDDWEKGTPSHPALLQWLGRQFVRDGYDVRKTCRLILTSQAYQRATDSSLHQTSPLFVSPASRRLTAEQLVDSLFSVTGKPFRTEEVSLDLDCRRDMGNAISLGHARRSWMLTSTSNERDRPSLNLPRIAAVADVLSAFGWRGSRQDPLSQRDESPNTLQPAILSNGIMMTWLTTLSDDHGITTLALRHQSVEKLIDALFLKLLTRHPSQREQQRLVDLLSPGYQERIANVSETSPSKTVRKPRPYVTWSNHLDPEATIVRQQEETDARRGDPPTARLQADWRLRLEDALWSILNTPEMMYVR